MITDFVLQPIEAAFEIVTCLIPICLSDPIRMKKDDHLVEIDGAEKNADVSITYSCNLSIVRMNLHCRDCFRISQAFRPDTIERSLSNEKDDDYMLGRKIMKCFQDVVCLTYFFQASSVIESVGTFSF